VTHDLQARVDTLTARTVDLGRLRNCTAASRHAPAGAGPAPTQSDGVPGNRIDDLQTQQTFGIELVRYAGECERYRSQLKALQDWLLQLP
jgi:hypothetical protein